MEGFPTLVVYSVFPWVKQSHFPIKNVTPRLHPPSTLENTPPPVHSLEPETDQNSRDVALAQSLSISISVDGGKKSGRKSHPVTISNPPLFALRQDFWEPPPGRPTPRPLGGSVARLSADAHAPAVVLQAFEPRPDTTPLPGGPVDARKKWQTTMDLHGLYNQVLRHAQ